MKSCQVCCSEIRNVTVEKGHVAILKNVSLHMHCDQITAIIGPNGAGKTTLFRTILGEMKYEGEITFVTQHEDGKRKKPMIGYVPQHLNFDHTTPLTVVELFGACLQKQPIWRKFNSDFRQKILKVLHEVELEYAIDYKIGMLSGGELQRVLLALALLPTPDILLLDEPISGVDVSGQKLFYEKVASLKEKYHMAILLITHDLDHLETICDQAILLNKEVLCVGDPVKVKKVAKEVIG